MEYFNRSKPPNCGNCGHHLGETFQGAWKKMKSASPAIVEISQGVFWCRITGRDDDCFITSGSDMWSCTYEVNVNSDLASQYKCDHVKHAKNPDISGPVATYLPNNSSYLCSNSVRANLIEVVSSLPPATPVVVQVSDQVFAAFVLPTSSNPLGFCHVKRGAETKVAIVARLKSKDCRSFSSKVKGSTAKAFSLHLHLLFASLEQFPPAEHAGP